MTNFELVQLLLRNTNIYWRKFFVFLILAITVGGGYAIWQNQSKTSASNEFVKLTAEQAATPQNLDVIVTSNGQVLTEKKCLSNDLKILPNAYEISILALDSPGSFLSNFTVTMHLPEDVTADQVTQRVYAVHGIESHREYLADSRTLVFVADNIDQSASYTVVADLPKTILTPPPLKQLIFFLAQIPTKSYLIFAIGFPALTWIILIGMIIRRRQDQYFYISKKIVNVPPSGMSPAVVGALMDGRVGSREIAATLIDLACRNFLFINRHQDGTFSFGKRKSLDLEHSPQLHEFERILLSKIFMPQMYKSTGEDVQMRIGRHIFSRKIAEVYLNIYNEATKNGYFVQNPAVIHTYWRNTGVVAFFLSLVGFFYTAFYGPDPKYVLFFWIGQMAASWVIISISGLMPVRSVTGSVALRQWLQFKQYLTMNKRIEAGATLEDVFNKYLPYAIVFGDEITWANRFKETNFAKPDWYESDSAVVTLEAFTEELFPLITYVGTSLDKSHDPTVE